MLIEARMMMVVVMMMTMISFDLELDLINMAAEFAIFPVKL